MTSASLWLEITIAGFIYLCVLFFMVLQILGISNLDFFLGDDAVLPYVAVGIVGSSYLLGILSHRLQQLAFRQLSRRWEWIRRVMWSSNEKSWSEHYKNSVLIWQYGSERLQKEIDQQFSMLALFRSALIAFPLLGATVAWWIIRTPWRGAAWLVFVIGVALGIAFFFAYRRQEQHFWSIRKAAANELSKPRRDPGSQSRHLLSKADRRRSPLK